MIEARLHHPDPTIRRLAVRQLADADDDTAVPALLIGLQDADAQVRAEAAQALANWDRPDIAQALCAALEDEAVYAAAALSLEQIKNPHSGAAVLQWAQHARPAVARAALRAVRELRLPQSLQPALAAVQQADADLRLDAVCVLGWLRDIAALPVLARLAQEDGDARVRAAAVAALGMQHTPELQAALLSALHDPAWFVREAAAATLGKGGYRELAVQQALIAAMDDPWWQVSLQAARALGRLRARRAVPALSVLLVDAISNLRKEAAIALGETGDPAAIPALQAALNDSDPDVRKLARLALETLNHAPTAY